jgi:hypothetical protein
MNALEILGLMVAGLIGISFVVLCIITITYNDCLDELPNINNEIDDLPIAIPITDNNTC